MGDEKRGLSKWFDPSQVLPSIVASLVVIVLLFVGQRSLEALALFPTFASRSIYRAASGGICFNNNGLVIAVWAVVVGNAIVPGLTLNDRRVRILAGVAMIGVWGIGGYGAVTFVRDSTAAQVRSSIDRRIAALGPQLEPQREEELRAALAMMTTNADYDALQETMETYAKNGNLKLPDR